MAETPDKSDKILQGIQLTLQEIRDLRTDLREHLVRSDGDRKRADGDRKRADEDRRRSDERFELLIGEMREERRSGEHARRRMERVFVGIARAMRGDQRKTLEVLHRIERNQRVQRNGHPNGGNGGRKP